MLRNKTPFLFFPSTLSCMPCTTPSVPKFPKPYEILRQISLGYDKNNYYNSTASITEKGLLRQLVRPIMENSLFSGINWSHFRSRPKPAPTTTFRQNINVTTPLLQVTDLKSPQLCLRALTLPGPFQRLALLRGSGRSPLPPPLSTSVRINTNCKPHASLTHPLGLPHASLMPPLRIHHASLTPPL